MKQIKIGILLLSLMFLIGLSGCNKAEEEGAMEQTEESIGQAEDENEDSEDKEKDD